MIKSFGLQEINFVIICCHTPPPFHQTPLAKHNFSLKVEKQKSLCCGTCLSRVVAMWTRLDMGRVPTTVSGWVVYGDWLSPLHTSSFLSSQLDHHGVQGGCRRGWLVRVYTGHRVQGYGVYGVYGPAPASGGCVWGPIKWLYGAGGEEWALYCDSTQHWCRPLSLIQVTTLIPGYPSRTPGICVPSCPFIFEISKSGN